METLEPLDALDFVQENDHFAPFASNHFNGDDATTFFQDLINLGCTVTIDEAAIQYDDDGPGNHYADACHVTFGDFAETAIERCLQESPDEFEKQPDGTWWLWWD